LGRIFAFLWKLGTKLLKKRLFGTQFVSLFVLKKSNFAFSGDEILKKCRFNPHFFLQYQCLNAVNVSFCVSLCVKMGTKVRQNKSFGTHFLFFVLFLVKYEYVF
jgi:hypothetical protein